jgi:hypothetical protein
MGKNKMIKLLNLIKEINQQSPPNTVYHFTTPKNFVKIINSDKLKSDPKFKHISFTQDPELWVFQEFPDSNQEIGVRLEFETDSLPALEPFVFQGAPGEFLEHEQEWRTTSGDLVDIEGRILGSGTLQLTALTYWKKYLQENLPGHIYSRIEFI